MRPHPFGSFEPVKFPAAGDKVPCPFKHDPHFPQILKGESGIFSRRDNFIRSLGADSRDAEELFYARLVDLHGKILHVPKRPGAFGVVFGGEIFSRGRDLLASEAVKAQQPVRLVQPVFAQQPRARIGKKRIAYDGRVGGIIHPFEVVFLIHEFRQPQNLPVRFGRSADDHLRRLPCGEKTPRAPPFLSARPKLVLQGQSPFFFA